MSQYYAQKQKYRRNQENGSDLKNEDFQYKYDSVEDSSFHLVDTAKQKTSRFAQGFKKPWQTRGGRGGRGGAWGGRGGSAATQRKDPKEQVPARGQHGGPQGGAGGRGGRFGGRDGGRGGRGGGRWGGRRHQVPRIERQSSCKVGAEWKVIEEFDLAQLTKLSTKAPEVTDLVWAGELATYNDAYDRVTTKTEKPLQRMEDVEFYDVTTTDDPAIEKFASEGVGNVYGTDAILSLLMAAPRSIYPWDIVVQKVNGNTIIFDKRDTPAFDYLTVSETSHEPPAPLDENADPENDPRAINTPDKLALEATMINQNFSQQILFKGLGEEDAAAAAAVEKMELPNPFAVGDGEGTRPASIAYRYRSFALGEHNIVLRTELHANLVKRSQEEKLKMTAFALNEWDPRCSGGIEWRQKIDSQRGAVLATELKNNSCKLARWTAQSILAGADFMKIGYVSRVTRTNPYDHVVLATQFYKPRDFASQITLNVNNMWGIIKMLVDLFLKHDDGKFVIVRDANKATVRIYSVPQSTFESDDDEDDDDFADNNSQASSDEE